MPPFFLILTLTFPLWAAGAPRGPAAPASPGLTLKKADLAAPRAVDAFIDHALSRVRDVSLRDGHQSLDGNRWPIEERVPIARLIDKLGLHSVESGGGADYDVATIMGENPFDNQRKFNEAFILTPQQWLFRGRNALGMGPQPPDVIKAMVEHAVGNGLSRIRVFDGMNDNANIKSTVHAVNAIRDRMTDASWKDKPLVEGAVAYTVDPAGTPKQAKVWTIDAFIEQAKGLEAIGVHGIAIKDMAGVLTETAVAELIKRLHLEVGLPISVHSHSSTGRAPDVLLKALEMHRKIGADVVVDTAIGDLSGGTSHPDLRALLEAELAAAGFKPEDYKSNAKLGLLSLIEDMIAKTAAKYKPGRIPVDAELMALLDTSGIPGGMIGTTAKLIAPNIEEFRRRLSRPELTVNEVVKEGLRRVPQVRRDAGLPPLVTPMSQFVLMQSIFNFVYGDYTKLNPQLAGLVRGLFGRVRGPISPRLLKRVEAENLKETPFPAQGMPALMAEARDLAFRHRLDIPDPREAALLLTARNGKAVLTHDQGRFEPRVDKTPAPYRGPRGFQRLLGAREDGFPAVASLEGAKTRREVMEALKDVPGREEGLFRLKAMGLRGKALLAGEFILEEILGQRPAEAPRSIENARLSSLPPYIFVHLENLKKEAVNAGHEVVDLGKGSPDLPAPKAAVDALIAAVQDPKTHTYPPSDGTPDFRQAIADWYRKRFGVALDVETEVRPLIGSKEGIAHLLLAILNPGDMVLMPDPGYPAYDKQLAIVGAKILPMPLSEANGFLPDFAALDGAVRRAKAQGRVRAMILNYPSNPTGAVADLAFLERALDFARRHDLIVLYDNAYSDISFDGYVSPTMLEVPGAMERVIEYHSTSKNYSMAGFRVGFAVGNPKLVAAVTKLKGFFDYGIPAFNQAAAAAALRQGGEYVKATRATYEARRDALIGELAKIGWQVRPPKGAMYVWAKLPDAASGMTSLEFVERLMREKGVAITPGSAFGPGGEGYVRISLIQPEDRLREAVARIGAFLKSLAQN